MGRPDARWQTLTLAIGAALALPACGSVVRDRDPAAECNIDRTPTPIVSETRDARTVAYDRFALGITADAHGVYWAAFDGSMRMLASDAAEPRTLFQSKSNTTTVAVDPDAIYFHGSDGLSYSVVLYRLERTSTEPRILESMSSESPGGTQGPVLDAQRVYFVNDTGLVASVPKVGGETVDTVIESGHLAGYAGFAVDETHLYWLHSSFDISDLKRVAKTGGEPEVLASGFKSAGFPQVIGESVLFAAENGLFAVPKTGGCARTLLWNETHRVRGFVVESDQVYVKRATESDTGQSSLVRVPLAGGSAVELARGEFHSGQPGLAWHANRLYWTGDGGIYAFDL